MPISDKENAILAAIYGVAKLDEKQLTSEETVRNIGVIQVVLPIWERILPFIVADIMDAIEKHKKDKSHG